MLSFPCFLQINENGVISFERGFSNYNPEPFPVRGNAWIIASFWSDINLKAGGAAWYQEYLDPAVLTRASSDIACSFPLYRNFKANWTFVATWENVTFFGAGGNNKYKAGLKGGYNNTSFTRKSNLVVMKTD